VLFSFLCERDREELSATTLVESIVVCSVPAKKRGERDSENKLLLGERE
jgi:hypothetical protein